VKVGSTTKIKESENMCGRAGRPNGQKGCCTAHNKNDDVFSHELLRRPSSGKNIIKFCDPGSNCKQKPAATKKNMRLIVAIKRQCTHGKGNGFNTLEYFARN